MKVQRRRGERGWGGRGEGWWGRAGDTETSDFSSVTVVVCLAASQPPQAKKPADGSWPFQPSCLGEDHRLHTCLSFCSWRKYVIT